MLTQPLTALKPTEWLCERAVCGGHQGAHEKPFRSVHILCSHQHSAHRGVASPDVAARAYEGTDMAFNNGGLGPEMSFAHALLAAGAAGKVRVMQRSQEPGYRLQLCRLVNVLAMGTEACVCPM